MLKSLAAGGVIGSTLPTQWSKPLIESVVLPAHAQTTGPVVIGGGGGSSGVVGNIPVEGENGIMDFFVNPAIAQSSITDYCLEVEFTHDTNGVATSVSVIKACFNSCKPGTRWFDKNIQKTPLSGSGSSWSGTVAGFPLTLNNVSPLSSTKLADAVYGGLTGSLVPNKNCDCTCTNVAAEEAKQ